MKRLCLIVSLSLLTGCITASEIGNDGWGTTTTYLGLIPVRKKTVYRASAIRPSYSRATGGGADEQGPAPQ